MVLSELVKAVPEDQDEILSLIYGVVEKLNRSGIPQWDDVYPAASDVEEDLANGHLYVLRAEGTIVAAVTLNQSSDEAYGRGRWQYRGGNFAVVHRLCIKSGAQGQGIGLQLMRMAEKMLGEHGVESVRLDVFSQNPQALRLYEKPGYRIVGEVTWRKGLFYLMEKRIGA